VEFADPGEYTKPVLDRSAPILQAETFDLPLGVIDQPDKFIFGCSELG
jgi:hypothetical protein